MRNHIIKFSLVLCLGLAGAQFGIATASADQPIDKQKTDPIPELSLPYGIEKKYDFNPGTGYETNKNVPDKFQARVDAWNKDYVDSLGCKSNCEAPTQNSASAVVVCPTTLDDEQMRLCLGLPAVKKAVRVKRLNVQIGKAE